MEDWLVGLLALLFGALLCFRGYLALRVVIPLWGAFAGFMLGAGIVANGTDDGFLRSLLAWGVGAAFALVFGLLAYLYYEVSVVLALSAIGFVLGTSLMVALGVTWSWVIILVGVVVGAAFGFLAVVGDLPMLLLVVLSSLAGASTMVGGLMLLVGTLQTDELTSRTATERLDDGWWWYAGYVVLAIVGIVTQLRMVDDLRASTRQLWDEAGGRQLRRA